MLALRAGLRALVQVALVVKNPPPNAGDLGDLPGLGRSPGGGHGHPLQYSCLDNPVDRGAGRVAVHGVMTEETLNTQYSGW